MTACNAVRVAHWATAHDGLVMVGINVSSTIGRDTGPSTLQKVHQVSVLLMGVSLRPNVGGSRAARGAMNEPAS